MMKETQQLPWKFTPVSNFLYRQGFSYFLQQFKPIFAHPVYHRSTVSLYNNLCVGEYGFVFWATFLQINQPQFLFDRTWFLKPLIILFCLLGMSLAGPSDLPRPDQLLPVLNNKCPILKLFFRCQIQMSNHLQKWLVLQQNYLSLHGSYSTLGELVCFLSVNCH